MALRVTLAGQVGVGVGEAAGSAGGLGRPGRLGLAYLVWARQRPVPRDELAEVLWGEELPASWEQMLRGVVFKIRGVLASMGLDPAAALTTSGGAYQLHLPADAVVDVEEAAANLAAAVASLEAGYAGAAQSRAAEAVAVAALQFAPGASGTWAEARQGELAELHLGALEVLGRAALAQGDWAQAVAAAEQVLGREEFRETAYVILMDAHAGAGRRGEALRAYERCRHVLVEALGVDPSPPTEAAYLRLLGDDPAPAAVPAGLPLPAALAPAPGAFVVGRQAEAERLAAAFKRATVEARQAVVVAGEAGAGKTTLVAAAARSASDAGARVLYGRCDEALGVAYQPFAQALGHYVATAPEAELAAHVAVWGGEAARLVPELTRRLPAATPPPPTDADADRWRLFEAVADLIARAGTVAPVVVVLDDLHWAAAPTLLLLRHVLADTRPGAVLVLATYRDSDVGPEHPLVATLADLRRIPTVERLNLPGLDRDGVAAFVAATGVDDDGDGLARAVHAHTAGNPFFVGQLLAHLAETVATYRRQGAWSYYAEGPGLGVPEGVGEVVARRLARLSAAANRALVLASVVGADFDLEVIERAGDDDATATMDALEEAAAARLVVEGQPGSYRFAHALVRDALYGDLGGMRRARLHRRVGQAIESLPGDDSARQVALAHHFAEAAPAGCATKAADYALAAADHALAQPAAEDAVAFLQRGLRALDTQAPPDHQRRAAVLLALSNAFFRSGRNKEGAEIAVLAADAARAGGTVEQLAEAAFRQSLVAGEVAGQQELVEEALLAVGERSPSLRARLLAGLATVRVPFDEVSDRLSAEALRLARTACEPEAFRSVVQRRWGVVLGTPDVAELLALADQFVATAPARYAGNSGHDNRALSRLISADRAGFDADVAELDRLAEELHTWVARSGAVRWRVVQALMDGRYDEVEGLAARTDDIFAEKREIVRGRRLDMLYWDQGRFLELQELGARLAMEEPKFPQLAPLYRAWRALGLAEASNRAQATEELVELTAALASVPRVARMCITGNLAEAATLLEHRSCAGQLYDALRPFAGQMVAGQIACCLGSVDRHLGMLAMVLGHWNEAEAHFEAALVLDAAMSSPPLLARTRYWYARMLARRPEGDLARAADLAQAARSTAVELGMSALAAQAQALLAEL